MRTDFLPVLAIAKLEKFLQKLILATDDLEIGFEVGGVFPEKVEAIFESFTHGGKEGLR